MTTIPMRLVPIAARSAAQGVDMQAGAIVHDIGNLLQVLSCTLGAIERTVERGSADLPHLMKRARSTLEQAGTLTRRIVDQGASSTGTVRISDVLARMEETLRAAAGSRISVRFDVDVDVPAVHCDAFDLERVLLNLVVNARDAMPGGGSIRISGKRGPFPPGSPNDLLILTVADTGCGMTEEVRSRALEPRFTTKPAGRGSGIGLASVAAFARSQAGSVRIESELGQGTRISLMLPGRPAPKAIDSFMLGSAHIAA